MKELTTQQKSDHAELVMRLEKEQTLRLNAAAPVMYEALKKAVAMIKHIDCPQCDGSGGFYDCNGMPAQCQWCDEARIINEAIAKAEGE